MNRLATILLAALLPVGVGAADSNDFARAIRGLGAKEYKVREAASKLLDEAGLAAVPALEKAAQDSDPEIRVRAAEILAVARLGIPRDFPADLRVKVSEYPQSDLDEKQAIIASLVSLGAKAQPVLQRIAATEKTLDERLWVFVPVVERYGADLEKLPTLKADAPQFAERIEQFKLLQAILPEDPYLSLRVIRGFDERGQKKLADELFERAYELLGKVAADHPREVEYQNGLAWLCAVARRRLDDGLKHVATALQGNGERADYLDTKAELLFQKGQREQAITLIEKSIKLAPENKYFAKQLERMRKGDPAVAPPEPDPSIAEDPVVEE